MKRIKFFISGGLLGIFDNYGAYQRWVRTSSSRTKLFENMLDMCGMINDPTIPKAGKHRDLEPSQVRKSEEAVQKVLTAISHFTNPWRVPDKDKLYSLASGAPVPADIEFDVLRADELGKSLKEDLIQKRLKNKSEQSFFDPITRQKLKCMEDNSKAVPVKTSDRKLIQYKEQNDLAFKLLVKSQMLSIPLNLQVLMRYCLLPVDPCLGTVDGYFSKTNKAAPMHYLVADYIKDVVYPKDSFFTQDGNALFYTLTNLAQTFRGISLNILDLMLVKRDFIFSTDCYHTDSIKSQERKRRERGEDVERSCCLMVLRLTSLKTLSNFCLMRRTNNSYADCS